jgi:hypothetical protein
MIQAAEVDRILERACRAPSVHNTQPWTWRVGADRVDLFADYRRQLVYADPQGRDLMISCGAALHHFQVAARAMGYATSVRRVPRSGDEQLVASMQLTVAPAPEDAAALLEAISRRRTDRRRLTSWPVPGERLDALVAAGSQWGAQVLPLRGEAVKDRLLTLTRRADELQQRNRGYVQELNSWTTYWSDEGVPVSHIPRDARVTTTDVLNRRFRNGVLDDPVLEDEPAGDGLLLICTSSDDPLSRVRAGEALSAVWLQASQDGLSLVPLSQAVEVPETRRLLQDDVLGDRSVAQILLRVGWPPLERKPLPATPRRHVDDVRSFDRRVHG